MTTPPTAAPNAPSYTGLTSTSVVLNNVPALSAASTVINPLPTTVSVTNTSGVSADNTTFTLGTAHDSNGYVYYTAGSGASTKYIFFEPVPESSEGGWVIGSTLDDPETLDSDYSSGTVGNGNTFPLTGWNVEDKPGPAPIFTSSSGGGYSAATSLQVWRSTSSMMTSPVEVGVTPSTNYTDTGLTPGTTYYYMYVEVNSAGSAEGPISSVTTLSAQRINLTAVYVY